MISNKFAIGCRYQLKNHSDIKDGILKITDMRDDVIYYEVIKGMENDTNQKYFNEGTIFSDCLSIIEEDYFTKMIKGGIDNA